MANDKDELAKLLGQMADGEHAHDELRADQEHPHDHDDQIGDPSPQSSTAPSSATPSAPTPPPPASVTKPPTPPRPAPPKPATTIKASSPPTPVPGRPAPPASRPSAPASPTSRSPVPTSARPAPPPAAKPATPPRPAPTATPPRPTTPAPTATSSRPAAPAPPPAPVAAPPPQRAAEPTPPPPTEPSPVEEHVSEVVADEEVIERYSGTDDDAVIVPALATADFIPKPRPAPPRRQHLVQKLFFKQTIIPILLTLGLICLLIPTIGLLSNDTSPFSALKETIFPAIFYPLSFAFLIFGILTMLQVKKQLEPPPAAQQPD